MPRKSSPYDLFGFVALAMIGLLCCSCNPVHDQRVAIDKSSAGCDSLLSIAEHLAGSNTDLSWLYLEQARQKIDSHVHTNDYARYHLVGGRVYYYMDEYLPSMAHIEKAIAIYTSGNNKKGLAKAYEYLASTQAMIGHYQAAIESTLESIKIFEQLDDPVSLAGTMNYLGNIYIELGDFAKARHYLDRAYAGSLNDPKTLLHANVLATMGRLLMAEGDLAAAERHFQIAYQIRQECAEIRHISSSLTHLANLCILQERYPEAIKYLQETEQIYQQLNEKTGLFNVYISFGEAYLKSGDIQKARQFAHMAHDFADEIGSSRHLARSTRLLSSIHQNNNPIAAFDYFQQYHEYNSQIMSADNTRLFENIEQYYELQQNARDYETLQHKNRIKKQQNIILLLLIVALFISMVAGYFVLSYKNKILKSRQKLLKQENEVAEARNKLHLSEKLILKNDLELKNKELASKALELLHHVETMQSLAGKIENLKRSGSVKEKEVEDILHELSLKTRENVWDEFHAAFNSVHNEFYEHLLRICPDLSSSEIKIAALLKLNLCTKEIAAISYKSESAVKTARHRLRQKLNIGPEENLIGFLMKI